jgi:hypothetical protein
MDERAWCLPFSLFQVERYRFVRKDGLQKGESLALLLVDQE